MMKRIPVVVLSLLLAGCASQQATKLGTKPGSAPVTNPQPKVEARMETKPAASDAVRLGNFSVSLAVKDIAASRAFYEKLGFKLVGGDQSQNWVVLQNGDAKIGLFQGMFPRNMLTFNPGWDSNKATLPDFDDVRDLQKAFKARGLTPDPAIPAADESKAGPTYFMPTDPDGNPILFDQHVASPRK